MSAKDEHKNHISQQRKAQTDQSRTSEEGFRRLVELSFDGIVVHVEGKIVFINPAGAELFGAKTPEQLIGKPILDFVHPDYQGIVEERVQKVRKEGVGAPLLEEKFIRLDGTEMDVEVTGTHTIYEGMSAVQVVFRDISERKRMGEALRESEQRFRDLYENAPNAYFSIGTEGLVHRCNQRAEELLGYPRAELVGKPVLELYADTPQGKEKAAELFQRSLEGERIAGEELQMQKADGTLMWISLTVSTVRDANGRIVESRSMVVDVAERKRVEEALRKSEQEKTIILDSISELVAYQDTEMRVLWANRAAGESIGLAAEQLVGRHCYEIWNQRREPCIDCPVLKARETGQPQETEVTTPDGRIWFIRGYPVRDENDHVIGTVEVTLEITKRKRAENLMRVQRDLGLALGAAPGLDETLHLCTEAAIRASGMGGGGIYLVDETSGSLDLAFHTGLSPEFIESVSHYNADSANAQLVMLGEPVYTRYQDLGVPLSEVNHREHLRAIAVIPIRYEDQIIACLNIASYVLDEVPDFARAALETIATQIGGAITNAKVEQALRASQAKLQALFDSLEDFLFVLDMEGHILRVNPVVLERLGYSEEELLGERVLKVHPPDRREEAQAVVADIIAGKTAWSSIPLMAKDGTRIPVETKVTQARWNAQQVLIGVSRDITRRMQAENALRESEANLKQAQQIAHLGSWMLDLETNEFTVSEEMVRIYRYENLYAGSVSMEEFAQYIHPDDRERVASALGDAIAGRAPYDLEFRIARTDGEIRTLHAQGEVIRDESGKPIRMIGTGLDVTEHKRAEEELLRAQREWEEIFQAIGQPTLILDPRYHITAANRAAVRATGKSEDELLGKKCYEIFYKAETDHAPEGCPMEMMLASGRFETAEMEMKALGGLFLVSCTPVLDEGGRIEKVIHIATDIAEHRRLEREIEERRSYLESILANAPDAIVTMDAHHHILEWNPGAERLFGYAREEAVGRNIDELITGTDADAIREAAGLTQRVLNGTSIPPTETIRYRKDGSPVDVMISGSPIFMGNKVSGTIAVYTDITERKRTEEVLRRHERLAAVGQLAGGIAHDFNNLLTTIMLYAQMSLGKPDLPPDLVRSLKTIVSESRQATDLVQQILDFSRRSPIETYPVDLGPFIKEAFRVLQRTIPESISPLLEVGTETYRVNADPTRIQQVLMNLVINARDAMPEGGKLVIGLSRVDTSPGEKPPVRGMVPGKWIRLSVSDTGTGIPSKVLPHIFEPFFTTKPRGRGTGLGLPQVYGIVAQHEGFIGVETEVGKGTTFQVYLPAHEAEKAEPLQKEEKVPPPPEGKGEIILLVEDNKRIREAGRDILESLGYRVLTAVNGKMALMVYQTAEKIDLVLTDVVMPEMGGKELARELKRREPGLKTLAITGHLLTEDQKDLEKEGILDIIYKPFDVHVLAEVVRRVLDED